MNRNTNCCTLKLTSAVRDVNRGATGQSLVEIGNTGRAMMMSRCGSRPSAKTCAIDIQTLNFTR